MGILTWRGQHLREVLPQTVAGCFPWGVRGEESGVCVTAVLMRAEIVDMTETLLYSLLFVKQAHGVF